MNQKIARLEFIVGKVEHTVHRNYRFVDQKHVIHVDEKRFYLEKSKSKIRFPFDDRPDSDEMRHKSNMLKVIFLTAVDVP